MRSLMLCFPGRIFEFEHSETHKWHAHIVASYSRLNFNNQAWKQATDIHTILKDDFDLIDDNLKLPAVTALLLW